MKKFALMANLLVISIIPAYAQDLGLEITTDKETYYFGDYLRFTINVDAVTGDFAIIHIVDASGKKSSPINLPIVEKTTTITAPNPFGSEIFSEGEYAIEIDYDGKSDSYVFAVRDSGEVVIPVWIKDLGRWWIEGLITDSEFAKGIEYLIENNVIVISQGVSKENTESTIPNWIRDSTKWWIEEQTSDEEYASALEYLIKIGIIVINTSDENG